MNRDAHKKKGETAPRGTAKHATLGRRSTKIPMVPEADSLILLIAKQVKELPDAIGDLGGKASAAKRTKAEAPSALGTCLALQEQAVYGIVT